jgi:uncharacterized protein (UPF0261 family)
LRAGPNRRLIRTPLHLNDPKFADLLVNLFKEVMQPAGAARQALR